MGRKCPKGVICIENITMFFLLVVVTLGVYLYNKYRNGNYTNKTSEKIQQSDRLFVLNRQPQFQPSFLFPVSSGMFNPLVPPLKDAVFYPKNSSDPRGIPININTRGFDTSYKQVGVLTRINGKETILPLMGRPLHANHSKWQYYTMTDKSNAIKLPISYNGKSCTSDYGCNDLYNGDTVYVEGYKDAFKVTMYENNAPSYIPYI
tara:strand:- start:13 stop:627 length:615 start_codon:yes stop_codon:yes gene_type:complete